MEINVKVEIKGKLLKELKENPGEVSRKSIWAGMTWLVEAIEAKAKKEVPVKTSNLLRSITSNVSADGKKGTITAAAKKDGKPYGLFVHEGTGLFGPFKRLIRPTTQKALFWPGALHPVKSVKGMKPNPFFTRAVSQVDPQKVFEDGVWSYLQKFGA